MLVPFVIDADSLIPDSNNFNNCFEYKPALRACHKNLLTIWRRIGILVHDGHSLKESHLYQTIGKLPQGLRTDWLELLEKVPLISCKTDWNGTVERNTLMNFCFTAQLAIVDDTCAYIEFGFSDECDEKSVPIISSTSSIDICRLIAASQATQFKNALSQAEAHIECGDSYQKIWDIRFKMLAFAPIKKISIVDRYAVSQNYECPKEKLSGLARFLRLLDKDSTGDRYVTLYSAWTKELKEKSLSFDEIVADIQDIFDRLPIKNIKFIKIYMIPNSGFVRDAHDRFIRFDNYIWEIGRGLKVFEGPCAAQKSTATFKTEILAVKAFKDTEDELRKHPRVKFKECRL